METGVIEASLKIKGAPGKRSISQTLNGSFAKPPQGAVSICRRDWRAMGNSVDAPSPAGSPAISTAPIFMHLDGIPAGYIENFRDGHGAETWRADIGRLLTAEETKTQTEHIERSRA